MNWVALVASRIWHNLAGAPISESAKQAIVQSAIEDTEAARPFGAPVEDAAPSKQKEDEPLVRGEKLESLRARVVKWGGWESWKE